MDHIGNFIRAAILTLAALLPVINPPGSAPIFLSMTPGADEATRTALAWRIASNSFLLLVAATLIGSYVLAFFGLPVSVVRMAGGLLVSATGWRLLSADQNTDTDLASATALPGVSDIRQRSFYPLTFPLTVGPGSISVSVTLGAGTHGVNVDTAFGLAGTVVGLSIAAAAIYLAYRFATPVLRALGGTGTTILLRLSAFILLAVGVQIFCDGLVERFALAVAR
jgi:multiple antibiotic resistance protein